MRSLQLVAVIHDSKGLAEALGRELGLALFGSTELPLSVTHALSFTPQGEHSPLFFLRVI